MKITRFGAPAALALVGALALSACGGQQADGSDEPAPAAP